MSSGGSIELGMDERRALAGFCSRQDHWSPGGAARVLVTGATMGVFATTPWDAMTFAAVPIAREAGAVDLIVSLGALAEALAGEGPLDLDALPRATLPATAGVTLLDLPPREGWQVPIQGVSGDLAAQVAGGLAELQQRTAIMGPRDTDLEARLWWAQPGWAGLPTGVLFAAYQLGMLPTDQSKVAAAACGRWKRLSTQRGQVFSYASETTAGPSLSLIFPNGRS